MNAAVEGTVNKVRRQLMDLQSSVAPEDRADVWVEGQTPEGYLQVGGQVQRAGGGREGTAAA